MQTHAQACILWSKYTTNTPLIMKFFFQAFLSEKSLESSVKYIVRRFPNIDPKSLSNVQPLRNEVLKSLSLYYFTFVDLLDYRDHVTELLTTIGACGIGFDITVNYDLTRLYLEVVSSVQ